MALAFDFSNVYPGSFDLMVSKVILFLLFFAVIFAVLQKFLTNNNRAANAVISFIVSFLALYYVQVDWLINFVFSPYGLLGTFIIALIPFAIVFFIVESFDLVFFRKACILIMGFLYFIVGFNKLYEISPSVHLWQTPVIVYFVMAGLSVFIVVFEKFVRKKFVIKANPKKKSRR